MNYTNKRQIAKIKKSIASGAGTDIKISKTDKKIGETWWTLIHITHISWSKSTS